MVFHSDLREFVALLNQNEVRYLVTGGYAVAHYGHPRYTGDIDIWIDCHPKNAQKMLKVATDFGLASFNLTRDDFETPDRVIQIGHPPQRIDLLTSIDGVNFSEAFEGKEIVTIDEVEVNFISLEHLKQNKLATARPLDLDDVRRLEGK